jgi:hypothetical protein
LDKAILRKLNFFTIVSENTSDFVLFDILWTEFYSDWNTLQFPVVVFPAWVVIVSVIIMNSDIRFIKGCLKLFARLIDQLLFSFEWDWDDNGLNFRSSWGGQDLCHRHIA